MADKKQYKVFISSTFIDNQERRKTVEDAILRANMTPIGMERFTAYPKQDWGHILSKVRSCDMLLGIIAHRYGYIPDDYEISITEMEYDEAGKQKIDRLMFLIDPSLSVNHNADIDQDGDKWIKQGKLEQFKKRIGEETFFDTFKETTLGTKVLATLHEWRSKKEATQKGVAQSKQTEWTRKVDTTLDEDIHLYCAKAENLHAHVPVAGFSTQLKVPIDIDDIFVPLHAVANLSAVDNGIYLSADHAERCLKGCEEHSEIDLNEAFRQNMMKKRKGLVILGDPGSGKTTHLKTLLLACLRKGSEKIGLPEKMLPVFLPLRELKDLKNGLDTFIEKQLTGRFLETPAGFGQKMLHRGNLLLLFDGLDEVADLKHREEVSKWIIDAVTDLPSCRFVVTCRFAGYSDTVRLNENFLEMHIRPMTEEQAERFIHNWYRAVEGGLANDLAQGESIGRAKAEDLIAKLSEPDFRARRVFELTRNPLLLTNLCLVHRHRGSLPKKRARLYQECVDVLLEHWREAKGLNVGVDAQEGRLALQPVALWLHDEESRTKATAKELEPVLDPALKKIGWNKGDAKDFLKTVRDESGLLVGWDQEHYGFMHLGFQEYLAAREIRSKAFSNPNVIKELASHFGESWWEEVALLLLALEDPSLFEPFMREVVNLPAFANKDKLVEMCLDDAAEISMTPFLELLDKPAKKNRTIWGPQYEALRILNRFEPNSIKKLTGKLKNHPYGPIRDLFMAIERDASQQAKQEIIHTSPGGVELVCISGDSFMMGISDKEFERLKQQPPSGVDKEDWEKWLNYQKPRHQVDVPTFHMGRYPVTNQEYEKFLKDNPKAKEPKHWGDRKWNQPKQPVVGVSWHDASAFAEWVGCRLPSESEWEYACRGGTTVSRYDDLDKIAWYRKNSGSQTQPIGQKQPNAFGLYDTLGNVWEWNEDTWHESYKKAPDDGSAWITKKESDHRVIRGGSWVNDSGIVRASLRSGCGPDVRYDSVGFRICRDC